MQLRCGVRQPAAGNSYLINGSKAWITHGGLTDFYALFVRTGEGSGGVSCLLIQGQLAGLSVSLRRRWAAKERARSGDVDRAIELARAVIDDLFETGEMFTRGLATTVLVEALLERCTDTDLREAQAKIERLAVVPTDPGFLLHELPLLRLRALLARPRGDEVTYRDFADRYRRMATDLGFEGHIVLAKALT
jgi:hypothetical protein